MKALSENMSKEQYEMTFREADGEVKPYHLKVSVLNRSEQQAGDLFPFQMK